MHINKSSFLLVVILLCYAAGSNGQSTVKNYSNFLGKLRNIAALPMYESGTTVKQISSYDRSGGNDDGFSGKYSYLKKEANGLVIFDVKGKGVIERIWTPTPTDDTLDFYFDGADKPGFSIRFRDLFTGNVAPFLKPLVAYHLVGGYYSYLPIPYNKGCKIVFRGEKIMFHQIQYRELDQQSTVKTFNKAFTEAEQNEASRVADLWNNSNKSVGTFYGTAMQHVAKQVLLAPGQNITIAQLNQGGRITGIELEPSSLFAGELKPLDLRISWDDETTPAINVPVADFFGYAFGQQAMRSLLVGSTDAKAYCYFPMPFDTKAKVELVYRNTESSDLKPLKIKTNIYYNNQKRNAAKEGKFYAYWNHDEPRLGAPHVFLKGEGSGHYVGTILQSQATEFEHFTEFFEGDDKTIIDGEMTVHGTGSEDYFNGGWYAQPGGWVEKLGGPVSGCTNYSLPASRTGGYRLFISDKMPFSKTIEHTIEHGPDQNNREVSYTSVALYYANKAIAHNMPPANAQTKVFQPPTYTFYTRLMKHLSCNGGLVFKNGEAELAEKDNANLTINVSEIPKGKYKLFIHPTTTASGEIEVKVADERKVIDWTAVKRPGDGQDIYLGDIEVGDFYVPVSVLFRSKNNKPGLRFDRVMLVK